MLAEILAANAAFAAIKTAIKNGKEIADVASQVGKYVNATEDLRRKGEKKKRAGAKGKTVVANTRAGRVTKKYTK